MTEITVKIDQDKLNEWKSDFENFIQRAYQNEELSNEEYFTLTGCLTSIMSVDNFVRSVIVPDESSKPLIEMFPPMVEKTHIAHKNRLHQFR